MSRINKFLIVLISLVCCVCIGIDIWYAVVYFTQPEKQASQTYNVGAQTVTKVDGTEDTRYFCEVNLFDDCFEIKFNYLRDETGKDFYSQGVQYIPKTETFDFTPYVLDNNSYIYLGTYRDEEITTAGMWWWKKSETHRYYDRVFTNLYLKNLDIYNYASMDNFETVINDTNEITLNTSFTIELDGKIYSMRFNGAKAVENEDEVEMKKFFIQETTDSEFGKTYNDEIYIHYRNYRASDITYFSELLYNSIQTLDKGTDQAIIFQFGDLFDYYLYDEESGISSEQTISSDEYAKVVASIKSYYAIKVSIHEGNILSASDSLFGYFKGTKNYTTEEMITTDYYIGRPLILVEDKDMMLKEINGNRVLCLSDKFISDNEAYKSIVELKVVLSERLFEDISFLITEDSFSGFTVYKILLSTGEEVEYG